MKFTDEISNSAPEIITDFVLHGLQGDYDLDRDDEDYLNLPSIVRETIESEDKEITAKDIDNLSPEAKALYDRLKNS